jgi:hypothetical protein
MIQGAFPNQDGRRPRPGWRFDAPKAPTNSWCSEAEQSLPLRGASNVSPAPSRWLVAGSVKSDASLYGGQNVGNCGGTIKSQDGSIEAAIPADAFVVFHKL